MFIGTITFEIHVTLGCLTLVEFKLQTLQIQSSLVLTSPTEHKQKKRDSHRPTSKLSTHTYLSI